MSIKNIKISLLISLISAIIGSIQMYWFLPDGLSCIDAKSGVIDTILKFIPIQFILVFFIQVISKHNLKIYVISLFLSLFWFFVNKNDFTYRHACWSTYSKESIVNATLFFSLIPIITCLILFIIFWVLLNRRIKNI